MQHSIGQHRQSLARLGEDMAARYLEGLGCQVLERNARFRLGELDIVARDGSVVVFVEVKTRSSTAFGTPQEAVHPRKQERLRMLAREWLGRRRLGECRCRFDVIAIKVGREAVEVPPELLHIISAF